MQPASEDLVRFFKAAWPDVQRTLWTLFLASTGPMKSSIPHDVVVAGRGEGRDDVKLLDDLSSTFNLVQRDDTAPTLSWWCSPLVNREWLRSVCDAEVEISVLNSLTLFAEAGLTDALGKGVGLEFNRTGVLSLLSSRLEEWFVLAGLCLRALQSHEEETVRHAVVNQMLTVEWMKIVGFETAGNVVEWMLTDECALEGDLRLELGVLLRLTRSKEFDELVPAGDLLPSSVEYVIGMISELWPNNNADDTVEGESRKARPSLVSRFKAGLALWSARIQVPHGNGSSVVLEWGEDQILVLNSGSHALISQRITTEGDFATPELVIPHTINVTNWYAWNESVAIGLGSSGIVIVHPGDKCQEYPYGPVEDAWRLKGVKRDPEGRLALMVSGYVADDRGVVAQIGSAISMLLHGETHVGKVRQYKCLILDEALAGIVATTPGSDASNAEPRFESWEELHRLRPVDDAEQITRQFWRRTIWAETPLYELPGIDCVAQVTASDLVLHDHSSFKGLVEQLCWKVWDQVRRVDSQDLSLEPWSLQAACDHDLLTVGSLPPIHGPEDLIGFDGLHGLAANGHLASARVLVECLGIEHAREWLDGLNDDGNSALHIALESCQDEFVDWLVAEFGTRHVDTPNPFTGMTAFACAVELGDQDRAEWLIEVAGSKAVNFPNVYGYRPLHIAAAEGYGELVSWLMELVGRDVVDQKTMYGQTALSLAMAGKTMEHEAIAEWLMCCGADVDVTDANGTTPFLLAAADGADSNITKLLNMGTRALDVPDRFGITPHHESQGGYAYNAKEVIQDRVTNCWDDVTGDGEHIMTTMIRHEWDADDHLSGYAYATSDPNVVANDGMTPLHHAVLRGLHFGLVEDGPRALRTDLVNGEGYTPLALLLDQVGVSLRDVGSLLTVDTVTDLGPNGETMLDLALRSGDEALYGAVKAKWLEAGMPLPEARLEFLTAVESVEQGPSGNAQVFGSEDALGEGWTPGLVGVVVDDDPGLSEMLGLANANDTNMYGMDALALAAFHGHEDTFDYLIDRDGDSIDWSRTVRGLSYLHFAAMDDPGGVIVDAISEHFENAQSIITKCKPFHKCLRLHEVPEGADANAVLEDGSSILMWAAITENPCLVQALLDAGAETQAVDVGGNNALMYAAEDGHAAVLRVMLASGKFDVNAVNFDGESALWIACWKGHFDAVQCLLKVGDVSAESIEKALEIVDHSEIENLLTQCRQ